MKGAWSARWANWVVGLQATEAGWDVVVWQWLFNKPPSARRELESKKGFVTHEEAIKWACDVMRKDGATVMILDAPSMTLETVLQFAPAPMAVA